MPEDYKKISSFSFNNLIKLLFLIFVPFTLILLFVANIKFKIIAGIPHFGMPNNYSQCIRSLNSTFTNYMCEVIDKKQTAILHDVIAKKVFYNPNFVFPTNFEECVEAEKGRKMYSIKESILSQIGRGDNCTVWIPYKKGAEEVIGLCPEEYQFSKGVGLSTCHQIFHK
jgi:hypothetical protein